VQGLLLGIVLLWKNERYRKVSGNGLVVEECKACSDGGGMEVDNVCCNGAALEK